MPGDDRPAELSVRDRIPGSEAAMVLELVRAATDEDDVRPLSEHVMLHLRYGGDPGARDLLLRSRGELAGYAHLDPASPIEGPSGELVIHPAHRGHGLGLDLTLALVAEAGHGPLRLWAHGDLPAATRLAAAAGFDRVRSLWQMRRSLLSRIGQARLPDGVTVRPFAVGQDEQQWLQVNGRAFASHPEQGGWTRADLDLREREPWFDPDGFFLAERGGKIVGFHWTKVHGRTAAAGPGDGPRAQRDEGGAEPRADHGADHGAEHGADHGAEHGADHGAAADHGGGQAGHSHEPIGEVYVVGVDPAERGTGLGRALTVIGLRYLRSLGLLQVMLYVDESNTAAIGLYESLGFTHWATDVMFAGPVAPAALPGHPADVGGDSAT